MKPPVLMVRAKILQIAKAQKSGESFPWPISYGVHHSSLIIHHSKIHPFGCRAKGNDNAGKRQRNGNAASRTID
jgi:hypothetical protein